MKKWLRGLQFFSFIHSLDEEAIARSEKLWETVTYAINQVANLKVFLENGDIPMDNCYFERGMKPVTLARRNSLFSYTKIGAECNAIMYSIVETARANGADIYTYLKYLLREVPKHLDEKDHSFLDDMMPWSLPYLSFERYEREHHTDENIGHNDSSFWVSYHAFCRNLILTWIIYKPYTIG